MEESSLVQNFLDPCLICGRPISKLHLQVQICYGCAAFYRRSINSPKKYVCQNGKLQCKLKSQVKSMCRLCRFNRCKELNLRINKFQQPSAIFEIEYKPDESDPWNAPDLFHQINSTFKKLPTQTATNSNFLTHFFTSLSSMIEMSRPKNPPIEFKLEGTNSIFLRSLFSNKFALNTAKLLGSSPGFHKIPLNEKLIIHDRFWQMFLILRNQFVSTENFGSEKEFKCIVDNFQFVTDKTVRECYQIDVTLEGSRSLVVPWAIKMDQFYTEFKNLHPTFYEFYYICVIALWSFHSLPNLSEETHKLGEEMISDASTKLHEYYIQELRVQSYASRHAKLFKIASMVEHVIDSKIEMLRAWKLFNFASSSFTFCKFETNYFSYKN